MNTKNISRIIIIISFAYCLILISCNKDDFPFTIGTVDDIMGNEYNTVIIGTQEWMSENLKTIIYNDGSQITDTYYYNSIPENKDIYGLLYSMNAVNNGNLCPAGWHVPTEADWMKLSEFLGGNAVAGGKLKEAGTEHWDSPNSDATNESGFSALPGGWRILWYEHGISSGHWVPIYSGIGYHGLWWAARNDDPLSSPTSCSLGSYSAEMDLTFPVSSLHSLSVRCIKGVVKPFVTTLSITNITSNSAVCESSVTADGGERVTTRGVCWSTIQNPTISDNKTIDGSGTGNFTSQLTGLTDNETYYVRAYASNSLGTSYSNNQVSFTTLPTSGTVTDIEGNIYKVVSIGSQIWMAENLKTTRYNDGTVIIYDIGANTDPYYCWYDDDPSNKDTYGALYKWFTVKTGKLCPTGWHVPSKSEVEMLTTYLGGASTAGGKLKELGTEHWLTPNTGASDESGFTALPGGYLSRDSCFYDQGSIGLWWTSTRKDFDYMDLIGWSLQLNYEDMEAKFSTQLGYFGYSVRCVRNTW